MGAFLNPIEPALIITSAAAHFGGTSALAWMAQMLRGNLFPAVEGRRIEIPRSVGWTVTAAVLLTGHVFVLGPGVRF